MAVLSCMSAESMFVNDHVRREMQGNPGQSYMVDPLHVCQRPHGEDCPIFGTDPILGPWDHFAFIPVPLNGSAPNLTPEVANARAAVAALDSLARQLPDPTLLRRIALNREAQSTSALEGTFVPLAEVLALHWIRSAGRGGGSPPCRGSASGRLYEVDDGARVAHHRDV